MKIYRLAAVILLVLLSGTAVIYSLVTDYDDSFSTNGIVVTTGNGTASRMTLQNDGKIVVASDYGNTIALIRYLPDGTLDDTFGTAGVAVTELSTDWHDTLYISDLQVINMTLLSSGKLLVVGYTSTGDFDMNTPDMIVIRYLSDGTVDTTFGYNGLARIHVNGEDHAYAVVEKSDGKLIVVGDSVIQFNNPSPVILQLNENGTLDNTFGTNGVTQTLLGSSGNSFNLAVQDDNKIVVSGTAIIGSKPNGFVMRYTEDGIVDTSFSDDGYLSLDIGVTNTLGWDVVINPSGEILFSGTAYNGSDYDLFLAKIDVDGELVTSFGTDGVIESDFGDVGLYRGELALDLFSRVIVTGESDSNIFVARYTSTGSLDTTFDDDGFLAVPSSTNVRGVDVLIQPYDQKIVALGTFFDGINLVRLDGNVNNVYLPVAIR